MKRNRDIIEGTYTDPVEYQKLYDIDVFMFERYGYDGDFNELLDQLYPMSYEEMYREYDYQYYLDCLEYSNDRIFYRESDVDKINDSICPVMLWEDDDYYHQSYQEWGDELVVGRL